MIEQVFKGNSPQHSESVLTGAAFVAEVFFPEKSYKTIVGWNLGKRFKTFKQS